MYVCESWTLNKDLEKNNLAFENNCYRRVEIHRRVVEHIGKYDTLLEIHRRVVEHIGKYDTLLEIHRRVVEHIGKYDTLLEIHRRVVEHIGMTSMTCCWRYTGEL